MEDLRRISSPGTVAAILLAPAGTAIAAMPTRRLAIVGYLGLTLMCLAIATPALTTEDREGQAVLHVQRFAEAIAGLQSRDLSTIERRAALGDLLHQHIDIPGIARAVLGKTWRRTSTAQRGRYLEAFDGYMVGNLARYLAGTPGISLVVTGVAAGGKTDALVKTVISRADGARIKAIWRLRFGQAGPKVVDVLIDGISLVLTKRSEFAAVARRAGFDGLIDSLQVKTQLSRSPHND